MKNKKIIFHHPLPLNFDAPSGSGIRPVKMYKAFVSLGYDVDLVVGYSKERQESIKIVKAKVEAGEKYQFCYSEASTMPLALTDKDHIPRRPLMDARFFHYLKKKRIRVGVFYRDIYWRFEETVPSSPKNAIKKLLANLFYRVELFIYNLFIDKLFVPSLAMAKYLPLIQEEKFHELNPGSTPKANGANIPGSRLELLYVGGTVGFYNINLLVEVISKHFNDTINLTICTRPADASVLLQKVGSLPHNVKVVSRSGEELETLYQKADCACLYMQPTEYRAFAVPIKLFEYVSFGKPVIASANTWVGDFVREQKLGWTIEYKETELHCFLDELVAQKSSIPELSERIGKKASQYTWYKRCREVETLLGNIK
ncbi:hypothetical protein VIOR3934_06449 [Vibrio orientalis CIP 102891 = ATCC 33934]|uniref:Glycosyl transferase n=1 Tax=Vibrio orientalis CIP 102891 = ATCC 33934 TaxID=675816 RepID=C9QDF8_VIBOR|nr:glycosyltransferase [Vibrio orientalis]EEX95060.1 putative glycosyl transferase [Vibrio orientalis CIP 102891 = ATCC 33934]EGU52121.1 hypothetical protein VIOR3934_06449 [Vibrio orientalis CIP 102891 = ATCC 33934]